MLVGCFGVFPINPGLDIPDIVKIEILRDITTNRSLRCRKLSDAEVRRLGLHEVKQKTPGSKGTDVIYVCDGEFYIGRKGSKDVQPL